MPEKPENIDADEAKIVVIKTVLRVFEVWKEDGKGDEIDMESFCRILIMANCPNHRVAKQILANMVDAGYISWRKDENGTVLFKEKKENN